jgi:pimeloyl-ACP methyl ester carboxylesterase
VIWDRPNTGESDVLFTGASESEMQADALAALLRALDLGPALIFGGSGGSRVSLLAAARHPDVASKLAMWWISGGTFGLLTLAMVYCGESFRAAWQDGMEGVVELPEWAEVLERNPRNRERFLSLDRQEFLDTLDRWMRVYCPDPSATVPGLADDTLANLALPTLVFRSGASDPYHTRATSEGVHALIPGARIAEPPWGDREWIERSAAARAGTGHLFERWPLLAPQLLDFAST